MVKLRGHVVDLQASCGRLAGQAPTTALRLRGGCPAVAYTHGCLQLIFCSMNMPQLTSSLQWVQWVQRVP
eukprot:827822-Pelagomonas_calceolata.AAC.1